LGLVSDKPGKQEIQEELERLKGRFLSSLNHEMRTPLTGIIGMADLLRETALSAEQGEYVEIIRSCAGVLNDVLNATLEFATLSSGRAQREDAPFELMPCLEAIADEFSAKARAKGLEFFLRADGYLPAVVIGDEIRIRALLQQLLSNAVKFTESGRVQVNVQGRGGAEGPFWLDIEIIDTGIGIAADKLGGIFESFHHLDAHHEAGIVQQQAGLGLGLALAREIAHLLDGEITVQSIALQSTALQNTALQRTGLPGRGGTAPLERGTVFRLRLPLQATSEHPVAKPVPVVLEVPAERARILLVEDNRVSQRIVAHMLDRADFAATSVSNGMDAVRLAHEEQFALVLMDLQMPGIDGIETTYRLRRLPAYAQVPVVALTANAGDEFRELCRQHGFQGFLSKPVQADELVRAIEECLMSRAVA
jgi:signal transduction histidine kinase/CheY-like chemotaxis protein